MCCGYVQNMTVLSLLYFLPFFFKCICAQADLNLLMKGLQARDLIVYSRNENDLFLSQLSNAIQSNFDFIYQPPPPNQSGFQLLQFLSENAVLLFYDAEPNFVSSLIGTYMLLPLDSFVYETEFMIKCFFR